MESYFRKHKFQNLQISDADLQKMELIKVYIESSHFDRRLYKDSQGNLFLYEFNEFLTFSDREDIINEFFVLVKDELDADNLNKEGDIRRLPYIHIDNDNNLRVHE